MNPFTQPPPSTRIHLEGSQTGRSYDADQVHTIAPDSGRPLPARYELDRAAQTFNRENLAGRPRSMWRYSAVEDEQIVVAMARIGALEGIDACPKGAATFCALEQLVEQGLIEKGERVILFNCGTGLKHPVLRPR